MKKLIYLFVIILFFATSCEESCVNIIGSGKMTTKTIELTSFSGVKSDLPGDFILHRGESSVKIATDDNLIDLLSISIISGNNVNITVPDLTCFTPSEFKADIYSDNYNSIIVDGESNWTCDPLNLSPNIILNGKGTVKFTGISNNQVLTNNSSGLIDMTEMPTKNAEIYLNGEGDIKAKVSNEAIVKSKSTGDVYIYDIHGILDVTIQSSGNVYYSGNPSKIISVIQSSGKIIKM